MLKYFFRVDLSKKSGHFYLRIDNVNFAGKYEINGQILVLPIKGEGDANITFGKYPHLNHETIFI